MHSTHTALVVFCSLLLIYWFFREYLWLAIISECQIEIMNNNETSIFMQNTGATTQFNLI